MHDIAVVVFDHDIQKPVKAVGVPDFFNGCRGVVRICDLVRFKQRVCVRDRSRGIEGIQDSAGSAQPRCPGLYRGFLDDPRALADRLAGRDIAVVQPPQPIGVGNRRAFPQIKPVGEIVKCDNRHGYTSRGRAR